MFPKPSLIGELVERARTYRPLRIAIVNPVDAMDLAAIAATQDLAQYILVGPTAEIVERARQEAVSLAGCAFADAFRAEDASRVAVDLVRRGRADALMKGAVHSDTFLAAVLAEPTLHGSRRMSHVAVLEPANLDRLLLVSDGAVTIAPSLEEKRDIVQNAIDLALLLGIVSPKVAILAAVETVASRLPATIDAAALAKMADRRQITGAIVDGPLALDDALSPEAARRKGIASPVAGLADILIAPDLDAANILFKEIELGTHGRCGEIVMGARVPIVLTSRADDTPARVASIALAVLAGSAGTSISYRT